MGSMQAYEGEYKADKCEIYNHQSKEEIKDFLIKLGWRLKEGWRLRQIVQEDIDKGNSYLGANNPLLGGCKCGKVEVASGLYRLIIEKGSWIEPEEPEDPWQFEGYRPFFTSEVQELLQQHQDLTNEAICYTFFGDGSGSLHISWGAAALYFGTKGREHETQRLEKIKKFLEERRRDMKK